MTRLDQSFATACRLMIKRADAWLSDPSLWGSGMMQAGQPVSIGQTSIMGAPPVPTATMSGAGNNALGIAGTFGGNISNVAPSMLTPLPAGTAAPGMNAAAPVTAPVPSPVAPPTDQDVTGRFRPSWSPGSGMLTSTNAQASPTTPVQAGEQRGIVSQWGTGSSTILPKGAPKPSDPALVAETNRLKAQQAAPQTAGVPSPTTAPSGSWGAFKPQGTLAVRGGRVQTPGIQLPPSSGLTTSGPGGKPEPRRL